MPPLHLTDDELDAVMNAARPIAPELRDPFLKSVANALAGRMIGPGTVHQVCREAQRQFFDPPEFDGPGSGAHPGKYGR